MASYIHGHKSIKKEFMQSSMGYSCSKCEQTFLVGFADKDTGERICTPCANELKDDSNLIEKVY